MPWLCVTTPVIASPGIGRQHCASVTSTPCVPSTTISESASLRCCGGCAAGCGSATGVFGVSGVMRPKMLDGEWFPLPTAITSSSRLA